MRCAAHSARTGQARVGPELLDLVALVHVVEVDRLRGEERVPWGFM